MIRLENININFDLQLIKNGELLLSDTQINYIIGESGSGKTTLLMILGLLRNFESIKYFFDDVNMNTLSEKQKCIYRRDRIGYVFQENFTFEEFTVNEYLKLCSHIIGKHANQEDIDSILSKVGLWDKKEERLKYLSGGQKQRIQIAGEVLKKPRLLLLDEPTSYLDDENTNIVLALIKQIKQENDICIVISTHDSRLLDDYARIYKIDNGNLICNQGKIDEKSFIKDNNERNKKYIHYALLQYCNYLDKKVSILNKILLSLVTMILIWGNCYSFWYEEKMQSLVNDTGLNAIRIYYGDSDNKAYDTIQDAIELDTIQRIKMLNEIIDCTPFYQVESTYNQTPILMQTYSGSMDVYVDKELKKKGTCIVDGKDMKANIYMSHELYQLTNAVTLDMNVENHVLNISANKVLDDTMLNNYSNAGNKIVYIPLEVYKEICSKEKNSLLYTVQIKQGTDIQNVVTKIKNIDSNITVYSPIGIDNIQMFNQSVLSSMMVAIKLLLIGLLIIIILDKCKYISGLKKEIGLLKTKGIRMVDYIKVYALLQVKGSLYISIGTILVLGYIWVTNTITLPLFFLCIAYSMLVSLIIIITPIAYCLYLVKKYDVYALMNKES